MLLVIGLIVVVFANLIALYISSNRYPTSGFGRFALMVVAPCQELVSDGIDFVQDIWQNYFALVDVARENTRLKKTLRIAIAENSRHREIELSNIRLRNLLNFKTSLTKQALAAEVIGKDPSSWFQAITINKGTTDGVQKGLPVVIPEGVAGQVTDATKYYAKVMLIIDRNSAVDALVQRTRARGIIKGDLSGRCLFNYVVQTDDVRVGDKIITSGLDGVYPKSLVIGDVVGVVKRNSELFQEVKVSPAIDFEKLEEVLVILNPMQRKADQ